MSLFTFGLLVLPIVGLGILLVGSRSRLWPEMLGVAEGPAIGALLIGYSRLGPRPCPPGSTCGPDNPAWPWLVVAGLLATSGAVAYGVLARRGRRSVEAATSPAVPPRGAFELEGRTSGKAIASLAFGLAGVAGAQLFLPLVALVLGAAARRDIRTNPGLGGARMALAGIVLGLAAPLVAFGLFYALILLYRG